MFSISSLPVLLLSLLSPASFLPSSPLSLPPLPVSQLYAGKTLSPSNSACKKHNIVFVKEVGGVRCMVDKVLTTDYTCRYSLVEHTTCYCCGQILTFVELGRICTKFYKRSEAEKQVGQEPVIILPFSWGEGPDMVELDHL